MPPAAASAAAARACAWTGRGRDDAAAVAGGGRRRSRRWWWWWRGSWSWRWRWRRGHFSAALPQRAVRGHHLHQGLRGGPRVGDAQRGAARALRGLRGHHGGRRHHRPRHGPLQGLRIREHTFPFLLCFFLVPICCAGLGAWSVRFFFFSVGGQGPGSILELKVPNL